MTLTTSDQTLIELRIANEGKSLGVGYLLWALLGLFGAHRFYLGKYGSGFLMLVLGLVGFAVLPAPLLALSFLWLILDAFIIPVMARRIRTNMRRSLTREALKAKVG